MTDPPSLDLLTMGRLTVPPMEYPIAMSGIRLQIVEFPDGEPPRIIAGTFPCNADPCSLHGTCHCMCRCGCGEDCPDCEGLSD